METRLVDRLQLPPPASIPKGHIQDDALSITWTDSSLQLRPASNEGGTERSWPFESLSIQLSRSSRTIAPSIWQRMSGRSSTHQPVLVLELRHARGVALRLLADAPSSAVLDGLNTLHVDEGRSARFDDICALLDAARAGGAEIVRWAPSAVQEDLDSPDSPWVTQRWFAWFATILIGALLTGVGFYLIVWVVEPRQGWFGVLVYCNPLIPIVASRELLNRTAVTTILMWLAVLSFGLLYIFVIVLVAAPYIHHSDTFFIPEQIKAGHGILPYQAGLIVLSHILLRFPVARIDSAGVLQRTLFSSRRTPWSDSAAIGKIARSKKNSLLWTSREIELLSACADALDEAESIFAQWRDNPELLRDQRDLFRGPLDGDWFYVNALIGSGLLAAVGAILVLLHLLVGHGMQYGLHGVHLLALGALAFWLGRLPRESPFA